MWRSTKRKRQENQDERVVDKGTARTEKKAEQSGRLSRPPTPLPDGQRVHARLPGHFQRRAAVSQRRGPHSRQRTHTAAQPHELSLLPRLCTRPGLREAQKRREQ